MSTVLPNGLVVTVSRHAADRWHERIEPDQPHWTAFQRAEADLSNSVELPRILARKFFPRSRLRGRSVSIRVTSRAAFILRRSHVLTVLPFSEDGIACLLVWTLTDTLPTEHPCWDEWESWEG